MISIIIPVYNSVKYLPDLIVYLENQRSKEFEVIWVDDGSTDNSVEFLESHKLRFSSQLIQKENGGSASARNLGIEHAKGEYLIFLDSDDLILENRIEFDLKMLAKNDYDIIISSAITFKTDLQKNAAVKLLKNINKGLSELDEPVTKLLKFDFQIPILAATVKTSIVKELKSFDPTVKYCEDYDFWLRFFHLKPKCLLSNETTCAYRFGHGSKSDMVEKKYFSRKMILEKFYKQKLTENLLSIKSYSFAATAITTANDFHRLRDFVSFRKYYREAKKVNSAVLRFKEHKRFILSYFMASK